MSRPPPIGPFESNSLTLQQVYLRTGSNLPAAEALFGEGLHTRFVGLNGSAYVVGGFGFTAAMYDEMVVVPIRTGVGARLGVNVGYLKFTPDPTWNPF